MTDSALWRHVQASEGRVLLGLKHPGTERGVVEGHVIPSSDEWLHWAEAAEEVSGVDLLSVDSLLPRSRILVASLSALREVRAKPFVDYVEPYGLADGAAFGPSSGLGCEGPSPFAGDTLFLASGDAYSPKHVELGIYDAWRHVSGRDVAIAVIDTGIYPSQLELRGDAGTFNSGQSQGRSWTWSDPFGASSTPVDECGHGTEAASVAVAPMNGYGTVGVAWGSGLVAVRQSDDILALTSAQAIDGIRAAGTAMMGHPRRIMSMSYHSFDVWWNSVSDEIDWWHTNQQPLLMFAAAGTSQEAICSVGEVSIDVGLAAVAAGVASGAWVLVGIGGVVAAAGDFACDTAGMENVVFPANHPNVHAVTCIEFSTWSTRGSMCHVGSEVEFTAFRHVPSASDQPSWIDGFGGSSAATPTVAGQAALIWEMFPSLSASQVLDRMRSAAVFAGNRHSKFGHGSVDVYEAIGGLHDVGMNVTLLSGGGFNEVAYYRLDLFYSGGWGPFSIEWDDGSTGTSRYVSVGPGDDPHGYAVAVTDQFDGVTRTGAVKLDPPPGGCEDPSSLYCN